eukprot:c10310_g1_i1 orf=69-581(+)
MASSEAAMEAGSHGAERRYRGSLPRYAAPWMEMGKLKEREKWQAFTVQLMQGAIGSELENLKRGMVEAFVVGPTPAPPQTGLRSSTFGALGRPLARVDTSRATVSPELKQQLTASVDSTKAKISSILSDYIKFFAPESTNTDADDAIGLDKPSDPPISNEQVSKVEFGTV